MARDYSTRRKAFGKILENYPLHVQTLARMEVEVRAATLLLLEISRYLGREDVGTASDQELPDDKTAYTPGQTVHWEAG